MTKDELNNPEVLHTVGQGTKSPTGPNFVNPGTPSPMASLTDLPVPELNKTGSQKLRANLIKDRS